MKRGKRLYWVLKRKTKIHVLIIGVDHVISKLENGGGQHLVSVLDGCLLWESWLYSAVKENNLTLFYSFDNGNISNWK